VIACLTNFFFLRLIGRFPYLLQKDEALLRTLSKHGWQVNHSAGKVLWAYTAEEIEGRGQWGIKPANKSRAPEEW
jgi:hypothetical protein